MSYNRDQIAVGRVGIADLVGHLSRRLAGIRGTVPSLLDAISQGAGHGWGVLTDPIDLDDLRAVDRGSVAGREALAWKGVVLKDVGQECVAGREVLAWKGVDLKDMGLKDMGRGCAAVRVVRAWKGVVLKDVGRECVAGREALQSLRMWM